MIQRLYVDNYKCLVNFDLKLAEMSLLLGPNGVGKSSVLDVVYAVRQLLGGVAKVTDPEVFPTSTLTRWQARDVQVFEMAFLFSDEPEPLTYRLEVEHERAVERARIRLERLNAGGKPLFEFQEGEVQLYRDDHSEGPNYTTDWTESAMARVAERHDNRRLCRVREFIRKIVVCGLYPRRFEAESRREDPMLDRDGANFSAWYRHMFQERQDLLPDYIRTLADVIDGFSGIRLEKVGQNARAFTVVLEEDGQRYELRLDELSDGERALIALYALATVGQGYALFLDEPDNYVALAEIQPWLMALKDACGDTVPQAVLCSHHPELIDYLGPDAGLLLRRESSGVIVPASLRAPSDAGGLKLSEIVARGWEA